MSPCPGAPKSGGGARAAPCQIAPAPLISMVNIDMKTKGSVFSERATRLSINGQYTVPITSIVVFSVSRVVFELLVIFVYNGIFIYRGNFTKILVLTLKVMNSYQGNHKSFVYKWYRAPVRREKNALARSLRPVEEFEKNKKHKMVGPDKTPTYHLA